MTFIGSPPPRIPSFEVRPRCPTCGNIYWNHPPTIWEDKDGSIIHTWNCGHYRTLREGGA